MADPDIPTEALEADDQDPAFLAALHAVHNVDCPEGPGCREELGTWGRYGRYARAAIDAARPHLIAEGRRQAAADIRAIDVGRIEHLHGDGTRVGLTVAAIIAERGNG